MNESLTIDGKKFISARRAAEITKYSNDYVGQLCRDGKINARRVGRIWFVDEESIMEHKKNSEVQLSRNGHGSYAPVQTSFATSKPSVDGVKISDTKSHVSRRLQFTSRDGGEVKQEVPHTHWSDMNGYKHETKRTEPSPLRYEVEKADFLPRLRKSEDLKPTVPKQSAPSAKQPAKVKEEAKERVTEAANLGKIGPIISRSRPTEMTVYSAFNHRVALGFAIFFILCGFAGLGQAALRSKGIFPIQIAYDFVKENLAYSKTLSYGEIMPKTDISQSIESSMSATIRDSIKSGITTFASSVRSGLRRFLGIKDPTIPGTNVNSASPTPTQVAVNAKPSLNKATETRIIEKPVVTTINTVDQSIFDRIASVEKRLLGFQEFQKSQDYAIYDHFGQSAGSGTTINNVTNISSGMPAYASTTALTVSTVASTTALVISGLADGNNHCLQIDVSGNVAAAALPCGSGSGSGTVNSGTTGQIAYYGADGTALSATSTLFIAANSFVGIGTSTPITMLNVVGTGNTSIPSLSTALSGANSSAIFGNSGTNNILAIGQSNSGYAWLQGRSLLNDGSSQSIILNALGGNVGIGITSPSETLHIKANETGAGATQFRLDNGGTFGNEVGMEFYTSATDSTGSTRTGRIYGVWDGGSYANSRLTFQSVKSGNVLDDTFTIKNGNVGIGNVTPSQKLNVQGTVAAQMFQATSTTATSTFAGGVAIGGINFFGNSSVNQFILNSTYNKIDSSPTAYILGGGANGWPNLIGSTGLPNGTPTGLNLVDWSSDTSYVAGMSDVALIAGGYDNIVNQEAGVIVGGGHNFIKSNVQAHSIIGGGSYNVISAGRSGIFNGKGNSITGASSLFGFIGGGYQNNIIGSYSSILGGDTNFVEGSYSAVLGGRGNIASSSYSIVAGRRAKTTTAATGAFAFSDSSDSDFVVSTQDMFGARFSGGYSLMGGKVGIGTTSPFGRLSVDAPAGQASFVVGSSTATSFIVDKSGNVGIGTKSPVTKLHLVDANTPRITIEDTTNSLQTFIQSSDQQGAVGTLSNRPFGIYTNSLERISILSSGEVGIGTTSPYATFSITDAGTPGVTSLAINNRLRFSGDGVMLWGQSANAGFLSWNTGTAIVGSLTGTDLVFNAGGNSSGAERMRITSTGNVGIGTTTPAAQLQILSTSEQLRLSYDTSNRLGATVGSAGDVTFNAIGSSGSFMFNRNGGNKVIIDSSGNVGIGTTSPYAKLSVRGGGTTTGVNFQTTNSSDSPLFTILDSGNVGIGTTTPDTKLTIWDSSGGLVAGQTALRISSGYSTSAIGSGGKVVFSASNVPGTDTAAIRAYTFGPSSTGLAFDTGWAGPTTKMVIDNSGNVGIGTSTPITMLNVVGTGNTSIPSLSTALSGANSSAIFGNSGTGNILAIGQSNSGYVWLQGRSLLNNGGSQSIILNALGGNVGIGTTSPYSRLSVVGQIVAQNFVSTSTTSTSTFAGAVTVGSLVPATTTQLQVTGTYANLTADRTPASLISLFPSVDNDGSGVTNLQSGWNNSSNYGIFNLQLGYYLGGNQTRNVLTALGNGNVGIGTTSPASQLDISGESANLPSTNLYGQFNISGSTNAAHRLSIGVLTSGSQAGSGYLQALTNTQVFTNLLLNPRGGNIGIGTTTPVEKLSINNGATVTVSTAMRIEGNLSAVNSGHTIDWYSAGANGVTAYARIGGLTDALGGGGVLAFYTGTFGSVSTEKMRVDRLGNVGIGTTSPYAKLSVVGPVVAEYFIATSTNATSSFNGAVGVSTSTPSSTYALSVGGSMYVAASASTLARFQSLSATSPDIIFAGTDRSITLRAGVNSLTTLGGFVSNSVNATAYPFLAFQNSNATKAYGSLQGDLFESDGTLALRNGVTTSSATQGGQTLNIYGTSTASNNTYERMSIQATSTYFGFVSENKGIGSVTRPFYFGGSNVGIGTTTPFAKLSIFNSASTDPTTVFAIGSTTATFATTTLFSIQNTGVFTANHANATSTINGNLYVNGTLRSTLSYVGDLFFANGFSFKEAPYEYPASTTQGLILKNQRGVPVITFDENGNIEASGDICSNTTFCYGRSISLLNDALNELGTTTMKIKLGLESMGGNSASTTSNMNMIVAAIDSLNARIDLVASTTPSSASTTEALVLGLISNNSFLANVMASTSDTIASTTAERFANDSSFVGRIAVSVKNIIQSMGEWVIDSVVAKIIRTSHVETQTATVKHGLEMVDQATGMTYCVTILNGDWHKQQGACTTIAENSMTGSSTAATTASSTDIVAHPIVNSTVLPSPVTPSPVTNPTTQPVVTSTSTPVTGSTTPAVATGSSTPVATPPPQNTNNGGGSGSFEAVTPAPTVEATASPDASPIVSPAASPAASPSAAPETGAVSTPEDGGNKRSDL